MEESRNSKSLGFHGVAMIATAVGAVAVGAFAIGVLAIGRLAIRRVVIESAELKSLQIQDLTVKRLRAAEITVSESLQLPEEESARKISSCKGCCIQNLSRRKRCHANRACSPESFWSLFPR